MRNALQIDGVQTRISATDFTLESKMDWRTRTRQRMKDLHLTHSEMGEILGVTPGAVSHYLTGHNEPSVERFIKICQALDVSADWLLFGDARSRPSSNLSKAAQRIADAWEKLPKERQRDIEGALKVFSK